MIAASRVLRRLLRALMPGRVGGDPALRAIGRRGERAAARFLRRRGFRVLGRNVRSRRGEADLVCLDPDGRTIVIVEVRSRRLPAHPDRRDLPPEASVRSAKIEQVRRVAATIRSSNGWLDRPCRIDFVAVEWVGRSRRAIVRHHVNAM